MKRIPRIRFIAGGLAASAAAGLASRTFASTTRNIALPITMRVKLFSGLELTRVDLAGSVPLSIAIGADNRTMSAFTLDATSGTLSGDGASANVGNTEVIVRSQAPITLTATGPAGVLDKRTYNGTLSIRRVGTGLQVINTVDVESYVASTLASELSPGWPAESIKAQAILARTYGVRFAIHNTSRAYDVTDDTANQVYHGLAGVTPSFVSAASITAGVILRSLGAPADVFYSSTCGGHTAGSFELTGLPGPAYLNGVSDADPTGRPYCTKSQFFAWENSVAADALARVVDVSDIADVAIKDRYPDGRVWTIRFVSYERGSIDLSGYRFYTRCGAVLGYKVLPSTMFEVKATTAGWTFNGHGLGHGVGMCQWGARGRAEAGQTAEQILAAYFPGTAM
jgi:stage II sporulation protein D